ncbi:hypothetical protein [Marimonas arenosa]|uniref:Uncharacterized protein n=1 Tax=Marimonas arenosa TaxID=1795305 RepID=A0AAE3WDA2_9RHOB|nr:hypothetical protein [Marimonas arenosa]MDQ2090594.1 hypothetical protein [Marimonas arenosa]
MHRLILLILTLMLSGRMMTLLFIARAGRGAPGDPPLGWLMPLIGDAVIGLTGLVVALLVWKARGLAAWTAIIVWNAVAIWDALSAYIVSRTDPWPEFFMLQIFGASMFFMASAMHALSIWIAAHPDFRQRFLGAS